MILPSLLVAFLRNDTHIAPSCDLRGYMALSVRSLLTRPTLDAPRRALLPEAMAIRMFEVPSRQRLEGNKLRSQVAIEPCCFPRWSRGAICVSFFSLRKLDDRPNFHRALAAH